MLPGLGTGLLPALVPTRLVVRRAVPRAIHQVIAGKEWLAMSVVVAVLVGRAFSTCTTAPVRPALLALAMRYATQYAPAFRIARKPIRAGTAGTTASVRSALSAHTIRLALGFTPAIKTTFVWLTGAVRGTGTAIFAPCRITPAIAAYHGIYALPRHAVHARGTHPAGTAAPVRTALHPIACRCTTRAVDAGLAVLAATVSRAYLAVFLYGRVTFSVTTILKWQATPLDTGLF